MMVHLYTCTFEPAHDGPPIHMSQLIVVNIPHVQFTELLMVVHLYICTFEPAHDARALTPLFGNGARAHGLGKISCVFAKIVNFDIFLPLLD